MLKIGKNNNAMKRLITITIAALTASSSFAYYGDYSSSSAFELPWMGDVCRIPYDSMGYIGNNTLL